MPSKRPPPGLVACFLCSGCGCPACDGAGFVTLQKRQQQRQRQRQQHDSQQMSPTARALREIALRPSEAEAESARLREHFSRHLA
jgi:hypothetical protein